MLAMIIHLERSTRASCLGNYDNPIILYRLENKGFSCLHSTRITRNSCLSTKTIFFKEHVMCECGHVSLLTLFIIEYQSYYATQAS